jgi:NTE family protein
MSAEYTGKNGGNHKVSNGIGLALGGGMARGFAHIGVLKTLEKHNIKPTIIAGTSIGALVGACYLTGKLGELEDWARSLNRFKILSYLDLRVRSAGLIGGRKLNALLIQNFGSLRMEDLPHDFTAIAADLATGHEVWLNEGVLIDTIRASFALPGVFPPVQIGGRNLVDGALVNPCPVSVCGAHGARMTIAVDLNADMIGKATKPGNNFQTVAGFDLFNERDIPAEKQAPFLSNPLSHKLFKREPTGPSLFGVMISALGIMQDRLTRSRLAGDPPDIHIKPQLGHIGMLEFEKADDLIRLGAEAAERMMPDILAGTRLFLPPAQRPGYKPPEDMPSQTGDGDEI